MCQVSTEEWRGISGGASFCQVSVGCGVYLDFPSKRDRVNTLAHFSHQTQLPPACLNFVEQVDSVSVALSGWPALMEAYANIYAMHPYDLHEANMLVYRMNGAYCESVQSLRKDTPKLDYELVVLRNYTELSRLHESDAIEGGVYNAVPKYWYDATDYPNYSVSQLRAVFAIKQTWNKARFCVTYGFPAGAEFLRTRAERQGALSGGGTEYIYLHNVPLERLSLVQSIETA